MNRFLPSSQEWQTAVNILSKKEKIIFLVFFLAAWISAIGILITIDRHFSLKVPARGGEITEGVVGAPKFINPLLTISDTDRDLAHIVYAGLLKTDGEGNLTPDLADHYTVSEDGLVYIFILKENLFWQDGEKLTAEDIAFTINLAKNPKIGSPKRASWEGVAIETPSDREVRFRLKKPFAPFLENTTLGIMPKHIWSKITPEEFNLSDYNLRPVGAGPFKIETVNKSSSGNITDIILTRFSKYQPRPAYLDRIHFVFYSSKDELGAALQAGTVDSAAIGLENPNEYGETLAIKLPRVQALFFNQDSLSLFKDLPVREALALAVDRDRIIKEATGGRATPTSLPIPPGTFAYDASLESLGHDPQQAKNILAKAGYKDANEDGFVEKSSKKDTIPLKFRIATSDIPELIKTAELLKEMWREIGADVSVEVYELGDLEQTIIRPRNYDALLFGQVVGYDPDPYAFWHASQRKDPGLNIALYASTKVDDLLEKARTTTDREQRKTLYRSFEGELSKDKPAIFLYSPLYLYTIPKNLYGIHLEQIPLPQERFSQIASWYRDEKTVWNFLFKRGWLF